LNNLGYEAKRGRPGNKALCFFSPFRQERTPSFFLLKTDNGYTNYKDHGSGDGGDVYSFLMEYYKEDFPSAKKRLADMNISIEKQDFSSRQQKKIVEETKIIGITKPNKSIAYLRSRGIKRHIDSFVEIRYKHGKNIYFGAGVKNISGGYEIFQKNFKRSIGKKDITMIKKSKQHIIIFESYIDYISYIELYDTSSSILVLHSASMQNRAIEHILESRYAKVYLMLDNDRAGDRATIGIMAGIASAMSYNVFLLVLRSSYNNVSKSHNIIYNSFILAQIQQDWCEKVSVRNETSFFCERYNDQGV